MKIVGSVLFAIIISSCASRSVTPEVKEVKVSRDAAGKSCHELGKVTGTTTTARGTTDEALADLKREAANKGANYVQIKQYSDSQTSVTGIAYECL